MSWQATARDLDDQVAFARRYGAHADVIAVLERARGFAERQAEQEGRRALRERFDWEDKGS